MSIETFIFQSPSNLLNFFSLALQSYRISLGYFNLTLGPWHMFPETGTFFPCLLITFAQISP